RLRCRPDCHRLHQGRHGPGQRQDRRLGGRRIAGRRPLGCERQYRQARCEVEHQEPSAARRRVAWPNGELTTPPAAYSGTQILSLKVGGGITSSLIAAGLDPVDGLLLNGNDQLLPGGAIGSIWV